MKKVTKVIVAMMVLMLVVAMAACSTQPEATDTETDAAAAADTAATDTAKADAKVGPRTVGFVMIAGSIEHCQIFDQGVRSVVEANGDTVVTLDAVLDITKANQCVEDLIAQGVDAIILEGFDTEAHIGVLKQANEAGIICVQSDNWCNDTSVTVGQAASDNFMAGYLCGQDAAAKLAAAGTEGKAVVITNNSPAALDRIAGFVKAAEENGIEIVDSQVGAGVEEGSALMETWIQAHPEVNVVMANHDPAAMGAHAALKAANMLEGVLIYGVDGNTENLELIKAGEIAGTAKQDPYTMGVESAQFLYNYWNNVEGYEDHISIPVTFINADNVDEYLK